MKRSAALTFDAIPANARVLVYVRVSTEDQARGDAVSIPEQRRLCTELADRRGLKVDHVIEDHESGRNTARLERLASFCEAHPRTNQTRGLVVVLNASRWGRFVDDERLSTYYLVRLARVGWDVEFVQQPRSGNATADGVVEFVNAAAAAAESREREYRAVTGMLGRARAGYSQGRPPFGYARRALTTSGGDGRILRAGEESAPGEFVQLVPHPERAAIVREIFERYATGTVSSVDLARDFAARNLPGPFTDYPRRKWPNAWTPTAVRQVLRNRRYLGELTFNRTESLESGRRKRHRPREEWVTVPGAHEPLVEEATFERAQAQLQTHSQQPQTAHSPYLLSGLIRCASCRSPFVGAGGTRPRAKDPDRYRIYRDQGQVTEPAPRCSAPRTTVPKRFLEGAVLNLLSRMVQRAIDSGRFGRLLDTALSHRQASQTGKIEALRRDLIQAERTRDRLVDAVATGLLQDTEARNKLSEIRTRIDALRSEIDQARFAERGRKVSDADRLRITTLVRDLPARLAAAPPAEARVLVADWVQGIVVDKATRQVTVTLRRLPLGVLAQVRGDRRAPPSHVEFVAARPTKRHTVLKTRVPDR